jgi:NhaA family Na+:H+ antiporter
MSEEGDSAPVRDRWSESDLFVPRAFVRPAQRFMQEEAAGAVVMLLAASAALAWANSPWQDSYYELWSTPFVIELGDVIHLDLTLGEWVNEALMTLFFFVVSLEIKRELTSGELREPRRAALPVVAALGGMILPAGIYFALNPSGPAADGWGIPVATDIAFAVGVVTLVGRVAPAAKVFLLALAIVDDVGGIIVIAAFYTGDLSLGWLVAAGGLLAVVVVVARLHVRAMWVYVGLAILLWLATHESGIHATLAGVALGLVTPAWSFFDPKDYASHARPLVDRIDTTFADDELTTSELEENEADINELVRLSRESTSPLLTWLYWLGPVVAFVVVPLFALANAGVTFTADSFDDLGADRVLLGVVLGLVLGKTLGVVGATWLAVRLRFGRLPADTSWAQLCGLAVTAGIGFTVALFITTLAFTDPGLTESAKTGVLIASVLAGVGGYAILRLTGASRDEG